MFICPDQPTSLLFHTGRDTGVDYAACATSKCALLFAIIVFELSRLYLTYLHLSSRSTLSKPLRPRIKVERVMGLEPTTV